MSEYDIAAYVWPAYTGKEIRTNIFWPEGIGEWQSVKTAVSKFPGHTWPRKPVWGYCDEADPSVMEMQIDAALSHGVNTFIYDWYWFDKRPFLEQCLNDGFLKAPSSSQMKFYLMWANHDAVSVWDKRTSSHPSTVWLGSVDRKEFSRIAERLVENYFGLDNYYQIDGCPVFSIYDINNLISGLGGLEATRFALDELREKAVKKGLKGLNLQLILWSENAVNLSRVDSSRKGSTRDLVPLLGFDSVTHYQFVHFTRLNKPYPDLLEDVRSEYLRIREEYPVPYYPHVSIGWDNNPRFTDTVGPVMTGNTPSAFETALRNAKEYCDQNLSSPKLITVNSWNEWTETSYLEPDDRNGWGYLEAVRNVFKN